MSTRSRIAAVSLVLALAGAASSSQAREIYICPMAGYSTAASLELGENDASDAKVTGGLTWGGQLGFMAQGIMLVVSGVYYPVSVLPQWMQVISTISPATYALRGIRAAILEGATPADVWGDIWPLLVIGVVAIPLGLWVFRRGEQYAHQQLRLLSDPESGRGNLRHRRESAGLQGIPVPGQ